ncbi:putative lipoprotein/thioderoxin [Zunongwangia profunda SM-A87]|uniref:Lipoprotein/thioderoxin n=1 Tax=Zunongwangia profunda (strain DSM 18752 / CCTCC AB 206139 / SM-A87) TaxID=655815 RepID=D5BKV9_ZUNPS|nr:thioredoxin-like domain-containing protein [Zunongwangia profunda]ADF51858.1 putative lipoprotein/thioderoxin [Zunongwangia profunda SM-A87]
MKKILFLSLAFLIFSCKSELKKENNDLADFNLYLQTKEEIDTIMITDISQNREVHKIAYKDTIKINFKDSINDLYNVWFFKNGKMVSSPMQYSQLWLNGKNIEIKGTIDKKLIIDTIIGSDLYYNTKRYQTEYKSLYKTNADSSEINTFLLKNIQDNFDNPFSLPIMSTYIFRNQNNKSKLKELHQLVNKQSDLLKNHSFFNYHKELEKKLRITELDIHSFSFYNLKNDIVKLNFVKDKTYLIDLWFANCPPCVKDHKVISKKLNFLENNNIELIGISIDKEHSKWKNYLKTNQYNWKNVRQIDSLKTITQELGISAFPTYLLIDNGREIKITFNAFEEIENYLTEK